MSRAEVDLKTAVDKACNTDDVPPKRKHVRACIIYTWDHKNSRAFWNAMKISPIQKNGISIFKALITIHKVLQEGHPNALKDGYRNKDFIASLGHLHSFEARDYDKLIQEYDKYLLQKLEFHRNNSGFNGMFEYEEYISLRAVNDPNEGYESLIQLMDLQDSIDDLQKIIFASLRHSNGDLCKISALVALISESYGIYKFCTSMLRGMYQQLGEDEALSVLFERYDSIHYRLRDFYTDCKSLRFLTTLITIPRLSNSPPNLSINEDGSVPPAPRTRSNTESSSTHISSRPTSTMESFSSPPTPAPVDSLFLQQTGIFDQQAQQEQNRIQEQLELQRQQQLQEQLHQQQLFEQQQREQERQFLEQQQLLQNQQTQQQQSRVGELENDLLMFKAQYDNDQKLLQQYDARVKALENELLTLNETATKQVASKNEQANHLEDQVDNWTKKYESLAKLYSQLRQEHLNLLARFKKIQQKINSAQESIQKKEKLEKELSSKNVELADLIRERDRARLDYDRLRATKDQEIEKMEAMLREANSQINESGKIQNLNLSSIISKHQAEMDEMRKQLDDRDAKLRSLGNGNLEEKLKEKDIDLEIAQESLDTALRELAISKQDQDEIVNAQIDHILIKNIEKLRKLVDLILSNNISRIQTTKHELESPIQAGNLNSTSEYVLSILELSSDKATDFATNFNNFIVDEKSTYDDQDTNYQNIILSSSELTTYANDIMLNTKGISGVLSKTEEEKLLGLTKNVLDDVEDFFSRLVSDSLDRVGDEEEKMDFVIDCNLQVQNSLQDLSRYVDQLRPNNKMKFSGNVEDLVNHEMDSTAKTVEDASSFLNTLLKDPQIIGGNLEVNESIVALAIAITDAVKHLILAATASQKEIVSRSKGSQSRTEYYKKNNRWTEGLISASKAVAGATNMLIQTADGVLKQNNSYEQLIVASMEVSASTAQLVAASRVKASFISETQNNLEAASSEVTSTSKSLISKVRNMIIEDDTETQVDLNKLTPYEGKTVEMEQQVEILKLEHLLTKARKRLGEIRKHGYRDDDSDNE